MSYPTVPGEGAPRMKCSDLGVNAVTLAQGVTGGWGLGWEANGGSSEISQATGQAGAALRGVGLSTDPGSLCSSPLIQI